LDADQARAASQVESEISLKEYYRNIHGGSAGDDDSSSTSTPAKAVPGYLTRPGMLAPGSTSKPHTPRPSSSTRPAIASPRADASHATEDAPEPAGKLWNQPAVKTFTPFKPPAPASAVKRPLLGTSSQPHPSRLRESSASVAPSERGSPITSNSARAARERTLEELKASRDGSAKSKGKGRAVLDPSSDSYAELENSPPEHIERPSAQKKRRLDSPRSAAAAVGSVPAARPASRLSAADEALERALGKTAAPMRTTSLPDRLSSSSAKSQPLFRQDSSQSTASRPPREPFDDEDVLDEDEEDGLVSEDDMDVEMDSAVLGADVLASPDIERGGGRAAGTCSSSGTMSQSAGAVKRYNVRPRSDPPFVARPASPALTLLPRSRSANGPPRPPHSSPRSST